MSADKKKETIQSIIVISCVIFAVLMLVALITNLIKLATLSSREKELRAKIEKVNTQIQNQQSTLADQQTAEFIDRYVREYLDMQGNDEITFIGK